MGVCNKGCWLIVNKLLASQTARPQVCPEINLTAWLLCHIIILQHPGHLFMGIYVSWAGVGHNKEAEVSLIIENKLAGCGEEALTEEITHWRLCCKICLFLHLSRVWQDRWHLFILWKFWRGPSVYASIESSVQMLLFNNLVSSLWKLCSSFNLSDVTRVKLLKVILADVKLL